MRRQALWFVAGVVVGAVTSREIARYRRWGREFAPKTISRRLYREALVREMPCSEGAVFGGGYVYAAGHTVAIQEYDGATGTILLGSV